MRTAIDSHLHATISAAIGAIQHAVADALHLQLPGRYERRTRAIARPPRSHDRPIVPLTHRTLHAVVVYGALSPLFAKDDVRAAPNDWGSFPIFIAMMAGLEATDRSLENAARNKQGFPLLYSTGLGMVATLNTASGIFGYISFGAAIETVALLNVPEVRAAHH